MPVANRSTDSLGHAYWLTLRGELQMDLASRFSAEATTAGHRVLALKGISIAREFYDSFDRRPMADIDFLVVETDRFEAVSGIARLMGLVEVGASDHALVFKEPQTGVVLELHISLTACPGLFRLDHESLWRRRVKVADSGLERLGDADLVVHLALHTAFQHGFSANDFHYEDFSRALSTLAPSSSDIVDVAKESGALAAVAAMSVACARRFPEVSAVRGLARDLGDLCPTPIARWLDGWKTDAPPVSLSGMSFVRYHLAPSKILFLRRSLFPLPIPGRTTPQPSAWRRIRGLLDVFLLTAPTSRRTDR